MRLINGQTNKKLVHQTESSRNQFSLVLTHTLEAMENYCSLRSQSCHGNNEIKKESHFPNPNSLAPSSKEGQSGSGTDLFFIQLL